MCEVFDFVFLNLGNQAGKCDVVPNQKIDLFVEVTMEEALAARREYKDTVAALWE